MVDQDIAGPNGRPDARGCGEVRDGLRHEFRVAQARVARQGIDLEEASQIEKPRQREQVRGGVQVEGRGEELDYFFRRIRFDFQAYRGSAAPLANGFLDRLEQVFDFVVVDLILAVARHAEGGRVVD